jgi:hypothetical protein
MGLTSWRKGPRGKILPSDAAIAKNYLDKPELDHLNRIVTMYLDYAELQAIRQKPMTMKGWSVKLDAFLKFSEFEILSNTGTITHEVAKELALQEYEAFSKQQDAKYVSDFDQFIKQLPREGGKS